MRTQECSLSSMKGSWTFSVFPTPFSLLCNSSFFGVNHPIILPFITLYTCLKLSMVPHYLEINCKFIAFTCSQQLLELYFLLPYIKPPEILLKSLSPKIYTYTFFYMHARFSKWHVSAAQCLCKRQYWHLKIIFLVFGIILQLNRTLTIPYTCLFNASRTLVL
jgi:hypothetical protein